MSETKKGILSKIFGGKKSGCCDMKIEEVPAEPEQNTADQRPGTRPAASSSCCCGKQPKKAERW